MSQQNSRFYQKVTGKTPYFCALNIKTVCRLVLRPNAARVASVGATAARRERAV